MREIYRTACACGELVVREGRRVRQLLLNGTPQGGIALDNPGVAVTTYSRYFALGPLIAGAAKRVLFLGLGAGEGIRCLRQAWPRCRVEVAEIDPVVVQVARDYFGVTEDGGLHIAVADGREYLERSGGGYDLVYLDAYAGDALPFALATVECMRLVRSRLRPGGLAVGNFTGSPLTGTGSRPFRTLYRTLGAAFPTRYVFPVLWSRAGGATVWPNNILVFAGNVPRLSARELRARAAAAGLEECASDLYTGQVPTHDVPELRDRDAPPGGLWRLDGDPGAGGREPGAGK